MAKKNKGIKKSKSLQGEIIKIFQGNPEYIYNYKQISAIMGVKDSSVRKLIICILDDLAEQEILSQISRGKFQIKGGAVELIGVLQFIQRGGAFFISESLEDDIYIHPSKRDAHSLSISEAIYMGCPVIVSDKCGSYGDTDDVQLNRNGFVYECGNIAQLKSYIQKLANDIDLRTKFGTVSHKIAEESQEKAHSLGIKKALLENNLLIENCSNKH